MLFPQGKDNVPQRCSPNGNLGQEHCTAFISAVHWETRPNYLMLAEKKLTYSFGSFFQAHQGVPQDYHSCLFHQRHLDQPSYLSVSTNKAQQPLLSGTPIFIGLGTLFWWPLRQMRVLKTKVWLLSGSQLGKTVKSNAWSFVYRVLLANPMWGSI